MILLAILAAGSHYLLTNWLPDNRAPVIPALTAICTIIGSTLFGFITNPALAMASLFDIGIMAVLALWLALRPGKWPAIVTIGFFGLELLGTGYVVYAGTGDGLLTFQAIVGMVVQVIVVVLLVRYLVDRQYMLPDDIGEVFE
jgi:hypothetical protein